MAAIAWHAFRSGNMVARGLNVAFSSPQPLRPSIHHGCDYVIVQNVMTNPDGTPNLASVFVGSQAVQSFELRPGDLSKPIPVTNVAEVWCVDPLGAVFPVVLPPVPPYGEDFPLQNITFPNNVCTGGAFGFDPVVAGERLIHYVDHGIPQSQGSYTDQQFDIGNTGTVEFRFPDNQHSALAGIRYKVPADCSHLGNPPCVDRGFEVIRFGTLQSTLTFREGGAIVTPLIVPWVNTDVWRLSLRLGDCYAYLNDVEVARSSLLVPPQVASGAPMVLFVRVDISGGVNFGKVSLRRWGLSPSL